MKKALIGAVVFVLAILPVAVNASPQGKLNQVIGAGTISTDIVDGGGTTVASPSFNMSTTNVSTGCQTITGSYGSATQRVSVDNPGGANAGWTLAIAATSGPTAKWVDGAKNYSFNNPAGSGCTGGQMTLDPAAATLNLNGGSTATGVTKGTSTSFVSGTTDAITLMSASAASEDIWSGYLSGIGVSQKIPPSTAGGTYTIDLTQTVTAS